MRHLLEKSGKGSHPQFPRRCLAQRLLRRDFLSKTDIPGELYFPADNIAV
jgi:hypothetical protein